MDLITVSHSHCKKLLLKCTKFIHTSTLSYQMLGSLISLLVCFIFCFVCCFFPLFFSFLFFSFLFFFLLLILNSGNDKRTPQQLIHNLLAITKELKNDLKNNFHHSESQSALVCVAIYALSPPPLSSLIRK